MVIDDAVRPDQELFGLCLDLTAANPPYNPARASDPVSAYSMI